MKTIMKTMIKLSLMNKKTVVGFINLFDSNGIVEHVSVSAKDNKGE